MARGRAAAVKIGAGLLYVAAEGSDEPTTLTGAFPAAWVPLGYTDEGSEYTREVDSEGVEVEEELEEIRTVVTGVSETIAIALKEVTAFNLQIAYNGGTTLPTATGTGADKGVTILPPALGSESRLALALRTFDNQELWIWRRCFNTGSLAIQRRKGEASLVPVEFKVERPVLVPSAKLAGTDGTEPTVARIADAVRGGPVVP